MKIYNIVELLMHNTLLHYIAENADYTCKPTTVLFEVISGLSVISWIHVLNSLGSSKLTKITPEADTMLPVGASAVDLLFP